MPINKSILVKAIALTLFCIGITALRAQNKLQQFKVIGFYTDKNDLAHISFVHEANTWFSKMGTQYHFTFDSTNNRNNLNPAFLAQYKVVIFLDIRPDSIPQRQAFEQYMQNGGAWIGFHFAAFALTPSTYPQNWDWYHNIFLGSGEYSSNTWRPTTAILRIENKKNPVTRQLPQKFTAAPNEWYRWQNDLQKNPDIKILAVIDSSSFPLGTGPKPEEIWHRGYYPVVWTNIKYNMVYFNMGHNDIDFEGHTNKQLSSSFSEATQNKMIINALLWLGNKKNSVTSPMKK